MPSTPRIVRLDALRELQMRRRRRRRSRRRSRRVYRRRSDFVSRVLV